MTKERKKKKKVRRIDSSELPVNLDEYLPSNPHEIYRNVERRKRNKDEWDATIDRTLKGGSVRHTKKLYEKNQLPTKEQLVDVVTPRRNSFVNIITGEVEYRVGKGRGGKNIQYGSFDRRLRYYEGETIERNIQWYRQWWTWLKLAISLEGKLILDREVKINKKFYRDWNLDEIASIKYFDDWWKLHRHLFQSPRAEILKEYEDLDDGHIYLKIPKNRLHNEVVREVKELLHNKMHGNKSEYSFRENDTTPYLKVHQQWNIFILTRNGCSQKQIINWLNEKYSHLTKTKTEIINGKSVETRLPVISTPQSLSRSLKRSKERVLRVGEGVFP